MILLACSSGFLAGSRLRFGEDGLETSEQNNLEGVTMPTCSTHGPAWGTSVRGDEAAHGLPPEIVFYTNSRFDLIALHQ